MRLKSGLISSEVINMIFGEYDREMDIAVNRREAGKKDAKKAKK
jgi:hypothetical protein